MTQVSATGESVSVAVAEAERTEVAELPPLSDRLDTHALDALVASVATTSDSPALYVTFAYSSSRITIDDRDSITVHAATDPPPGGGVGARNGRRQHQ